MSKKIQEVESVILSIPEQVKVALDGRPQRWLAFEVRIPETELSRKMNNYKGMEFTDEEIQKINNRLNVQIKRH